MSEQEEQAKAVAKQIFVNPEIAARVVDNIVSDKPSGWSHRSNATYYKRVYGEEIKVAIDQMMIDGKDILYRYSTWCTPDTGLSKGTLYNRVNQSIRWLLERSSLADRKKYQEWSERVEVHRQADVGVRIKYITGLAPGGSVVNMPKPESVSPQVHKPLWQRRMDDWLEDNDNYDPFIKENLALTKEEITELKIKVSQLSNIQASITESYVHLLRINI